MNFFYGFKYWLFIYVSFILIVRKLRIIGSYLIILRKIFLNLKDFVYLLG